VKEKRDKPNRLLPQRGSNFENLTILFNDIPIAAGSDRFRLTEGSSSVGFAKPNEPLSCYQQFFISNTVLLNLSFSFTVGRNEIISELFKLYLL
jgi:hypothetical protein